MANYQKAISEQYRSYQKSLRIKGIENCCQEIEQAILTIHKFGEYPSEPRVSYSGDIMIKLSWT